MAPEANPVFPAYLLPSLSFPKRRRQQSSRSTTSETHEHAVPYLSHSPTSSVDSSPSSSPPNSSDLIRLLQATLQSETTLKPTPRKDRLRSILPNILRCDTCASDVAFASQIVSKGFTGRHGRAYLVEPITKGSWSFVRLEGSPEMGLLNIKVGQSVTRELLTGTHVVADVSCTICATVLGWKYVDAREQGQMYKIGKFILETKRVVPGFYWEDGDVRVNRGGEAMEDGKGKVVFDSEDDDECEDLFAGVWDAAVVKKRRARRLNVKRKANSEP
jgi:hypothetical protein